VDVGKLLHAPLSWSKHNLIRGPDPTTRANDPSCDYDTELLSHQNPSYKQHVEKFQNAAGKDCFEAFETFKNLPQPDHVPWVKNHPENKRKQYGTEVTFHETSINILFKVVAFKI